MERSLSPSLVCRWFPAAPALALLVACSDRAPSYRLEPVVSRGAPFHGVHGVRFADDGTLYAASVIGQSIFAVDVESGVVELFVGPREGMADDIAIGADGTMVWTAIEDGILYARSPDGSVRRVLEGYKGVNAVAFHPDGRRLFLTRVFYGDHLYEVDLYGAAPPRVIAEGIGGLNAFEVGEDGMIYGPLVFGGRVVRIDPESGAMTTVSEAFTRPGALKLESPGTALVLDAGAEIKRVDLSTGATTLVATLPSAGDNLDLDAQGRAYVSLSETNAILRIDPRSGEMSYVVEPAPLNSPAGFAVSTESGRDMLFVGDLFGGIKAVDAATGAIDHKAVELFQPVHITVTADSVYGVSEVFGTVERFDQTTFSVLDTWQGFNVPGDVLVAPNGDLVVAETGTGRVLRVTGPGDSDRTTIVQGLAGPRGLAWAGTDAVYVSETTGGRVIRVQLADGATEALAADLDRPEGLAVAADGTVLVVEVGAKALLGIDPASGERTMLAPDLPIGWADGPSLYRDVEVGAAGIYITSDVDNTLYRLAD